MGEKRALLSLHPLRQEPWVITTACRLPSANNSSSLYFTSTHSYKIHVIELFCIIIPFPKIESIEPKESNYD